MFKMNIAKVALCFISVSLIVECNAYQNPVIKTWGRREPYDYRVFYQVVNQDASWIPFLTTSKVVDVSNNPFQRSTYNPYVSMRQYAQPLTEHLVTLCKLQQNIPFRYITFIAAVDQMAEGSTAVLKSGGTGLPFVSIELTSVAFKGLSFIVEVYGR